MARLPNPGQDDGTWGGILNSFLGVAHDTTGNLLPGAINAAGGVVVTGSAGDGQSLQWDGTNNQWVPATLTGSGSVADATTGAKGIVKLAGDLGGTAASPSVLKVNGVSVPANPTAGQVLTATNGTVAVWQNPASSFTDPTTTKGDLIVHGASTTRLPVGTNGQVLTADSTQANGIKWASVSASGGGYNVVAKSGAYTASSGDFVVCNSSAGGFIVTLPAATVGGYVRVKKKGTDINAVSVVPPSGQIDGANSISVNNQYQCQDFMSDGTLWYQV